MSTARFIHPSLPRRPARTSQAAPPRVQCVLVEFSCVALRTPGVERRICGVSLRDGGRCVTIAIRRDRETKAAGRVLIMPGEAEVYRRAISNARHGIRAMTRVPAGHDMGFVVRSRVSRDPDDCGAPLLVIGRVNDRGDHLGKPMTLDGDELEALDRALHWLATEEARR